MKKALLSVFINMLMISSSASGQSWYAYKDHLIMSDEAIYIGKSPKNYDGFRIGFQCLRNEIIFEIDKDSFLAIDSSQLKVKMRADDKDAIGIHMQTYRGDDTRAYLRGNLKDLATYMIGATKVNVTILPSYGNMMFTTFYMNGSDYAIYKTFEYCNDALDIAEPMKPENRARKKERKPPVSKDTYINAKKEAIKNRFQALWFRPASGDSSLYTQILITMNSNGERETLELTKSSGNSTFDRSLLTAGKSMVKIVDFSDAKPADAAILESFCVNGTSERVEIDLSC